MSSINRFRKDVVIVETTKPVKAIANGSARKPVNPIKPTTDKYGLEKLSKAELIELVSEKLNQKITIPSDAKKVLLPYATKKQEHFIVITLDSAAKVIQLHVITIGLVNRTLVHPREVFMAAITDNATSIIVAHNHPSGNVEASREDLDLTKRLVQAGELLGIKVLDHVIFGKTNFRSMLESGEL